MKRALATLTLIVSLFMVASPALAHPLGNFTTNVHLGIDIDGAHLDVLLVVDMAEIPTFREALERNEDGTVDERDLVHYAHTKCDEHLSRLELTSDGVPIDLTVTGSKAEMQPGQNDLDTLRLECEYAGATGAATIDVLNGVYEERSGWAEIVVRGGTASGVGDRSPTLVLTQYPDSPPLDQRAASISIGEETPELGATMDRSDEQTGGPITERIAAMLERAGSAGGWIAVFAALALGATHALAPGHGKTLMAAYLVGRNGTPRQAAGLGLAVAVSHTLGVGVLGLMTAVASTRFQPETVYPWLTTGSALIVTGLGSAMLFRAIRGRRLHAHDHHHDDGHHEHHHHHEPPVDLGWRSLATLGLAGGLVPSASAVVLLLGAVAIGRVWFGVGLVFAFGVGMSIALVGAGLAALRISQFSLQRLERRWNVPRRLVPTIAGLAVTSFGAVLLWDATRSLL